MMTEREKNLILEIRKQKKLLRAFEIGSLSQKKCISEIERLRQELEIEHTIRIRLKQAANEVNHEETSHIYKSFGYLAITFVIITVLYMAKFRYLDKTEGFDGSGILIVLTSICGLLFYFGYLRRRLK